MGRLRWRFATEDRKSRAKGAIDIELRNAYLYQRSAAFPSIVARIGEKMGDSSSILDRIDIKILRALQAEGRLTNAELASRVNVSPATCHRRTQRLFGEGYITGVRAEIAPAAVGLGALVMVGVVLDRSTPESFAAFEGAVLGMKDVLDCNLVAGDFDYLLKIRVRDMADFNKLHGQKLIALPGVRQTRTFFVMKEVKENARLPF
jgi:Lrp/AsnC family transcriptional regulator, leucine-responsive regulatory protein